MKMKTDLILKRHLIPIILCCAAALSCSKEAKLSQFVNPFIGTAYTGHTYPDAAWPFGAVQAGPQTGNYDWRYCSGYNYEDQLIWGFTQDKVSGTGVSDYGDILAMPFSRKEREDFKSSFDKSTETAQPGYYSVNLTGNGVKAEMTCSEHVTFHRYTYDGPARKLLLDLQSGLVGSEEARHHRVIEAEISSPDAYTIEGHEYVSKWVKRHMYFVIKFDSPVIGKETLDMGAQEKAPTYVLDFGDGKRLCMKVALSTVSIEGARANMEAEIPGWNFEKVRSNAAQAWEKYFEAFTIEGTPEQKASFYTSLYHLFLQPGNIADVDGQYRGADDKTATVEGGKYYSTLSQWDTFRAANPFYALFLPDRMAGIAQTMMAHEQAIGFLPIWALAGKENYCMIGNHSVPPLVDACLKGLPGIDKEKAYQAVKQSLTVSHRESDWETYNAYGYYPFDIIRTESVSKTLECSYDDWCAAQLAKALGHDEDYDFFMKRSQSWRNLFDPDYKLARGKDSKGNWRTPFEPYALSHASTSGGDYTEGNAMQYSWHVLQDPEGLIEAMGGAAAFVERLDTLFADSQRDKAVGFVSDVTGLIGQYAHGNEPSHHTIYLYTIAGRQDRTAEKVREVFDKFYLAKPDGLCGNDDCGQMSAWYIFSALGFYPLNPVSGQYVLGAPQIPSATITLPNGKVFSMRAEGLSKENLYVESATFNGKPLDKTISYSDLSAGGELVFKMKAR